MAQQRIKALPGSGIVTYDVRTTNRAYMTLTSNAALKVIGIDTGEDVNLWISQDAAGNRILTILPFPGGANVIVGSETFNPAANTTTRLNIININNRLYLEYGGAGGAASSVSFANVTGKPTTLSGYGITDAIPSSQKGAANGVATLDGNALVPRGELAQGASSATTFLNGTSSWSPVPFASVSAKPTTLSGYGITDAIPISQKGVANGVATLDANVHVPAVQLGSGTADATTILHGDNTWAV